MTAQMQTRPSAVNQTPDPRIDSPQVKVIYPTPLEAVREPVTTQTPPVQEPTKPAAELQTRPAEKAPEHICKVDLQQAIKQNLVAFIALILLAVGIGYLIGKK